jgi:hypothetical protein
MTRERKHGARAARVPLAWKAGVLVACLGLGAGAARPINGLVGDQHPQKLNTRYLRFLREAADGRLRFAGCTVGCSPCLSPRRAIFSGSDTRSVYGRIDLTRSAP